MRDDELDTGAASTSEDADAGADAISTVAFTSSFDLADPGNTARVGVADRSADAVARPADAVASSALPISFSENATPMVFAATARRSAPAAQEPAFPAPARDVSPAEPVAGSADETPAAAPVFDLAPDTLAFGMPSAETTQGMPFAKPMEPVPFPEQAREPMREAPSAYGGVFADRTAQMPVQDGFAQDEAERDEPMTKQGRAPLLAKLFPKRDGAAAVQTSLPAQAPAMSAAKPRMLSSRARRTLIVAGCIVALLVAVYFSGVLFFSGHTFPNTKVNGQDASWTDIGELAAGRTTRVTDYAAHVAGDGVDLAFSGTDISLGFDGDAFGAAVADVVNEWAWPVELFVQRDYYVDEPLSFDEAKLSEIVGGPIDAFNESARAPEDATIAYDGGTGTFVVKEEVGGTEIDRDVALAEVSDAVRSLKGDIELGEAQLVQPAVFSDDARLAQAAAKAGEYLTRSISLSVGDTQVQTVGSDLIRGWVSLSDELAAVIDTGAVTTWTQGELSRRCDTIGAARTYTRADGKQCTVSGGTYGWSIDGASLAEELAGAIMDGSSTSIDMPMNSTAARWAPGGADWTSYIDVDLGEQHARYYDASGAIIWESDIVSGAAKNNRETPTGVYTINSNMGRDRTLIGSDENGDGKPDYETPVSYWMPFVGDSIAFHDANWRSSFGGTIYIENGSHGCVNLPVDKAAELYNILQVGTVVVSHA